jgi:hypothetical protein
MRLPRKNTIGWVLLGGMLAFSSTCTAQDPKTDPPPPTKTDAQQPQQPLSATGVRDSTSVEAVVPYSNAEPDSIPDTRPLSGFQQLSLGTSNANHSFLLPSFTAVAQVQSNPYTSGQYSGSSLSESGTLSGRLALNHITQSTSLTLDYLAGASFASGGGDGTSGIQSLDFSDTFHRGRWSLTAGDELMYLSQSPFGFGGLGGLNGYGVPLGNGGVGVGSGLGGSAPDQTVLVDGAARLSNGVLGQADYALTHRSSLTFGADYGFLKFFSNGFFNNSTLAIQGGYNYALSRQDSFSISYHYGRFMFANATPGFQNQGVSFGYARRVTSRISFQVGAGPEFQSFTLPLKGPSNLISWGLSSSLTYARGGLGAGISYSHALSGGSGVLGGAESDTVTANINQAINHDWSGSLSGGFSKNRALQQTTVNAGSISPEVWYFSARASRHFFANGSLFVNYGLSKQTGLTAICPLPSCQVGTITHTGSIGYTWGLRQIVLE